jgi:outer membrane protein OmpA-like peptidoglycan-associated protein
MQTNKILGTVLFYFFTLITLFAQSLDGYTFEEGNRGFLNQVKVTVYKMPDNAVIAELVTDADGHFVTETLAAGEYRIVAKKDIFYDKEISATVVDAKIFLKMEMKRKPGYLFDATIADARDDENVVVDAIQGADIEIYNRTQRTPVMVKKRYKDAFFQYTFEQGNHYTILLRKPGYLAKRIEAYVNIEGCIICVNGVSNLRPGITDNLTEGNSMGTLLCNIEMEKIKMDKRIALQNIYYDYNKSNIRSDAAKELDKAVQLMTANPGISVELGSHTDARGSDTYNQSLSQQRAESAVAFIISEGVDKARITAKGYGETQLSNRCANGVICSEDEHQKNRRTELRITGISMDSLEYLRWETLEQIVRDEEMKTGLKSLENQKEYRVEERPAAPKTNNAPKSNQTAEINNTVPEIIFTNMPTVDSHGKVTHKVESHQVINEKIIEEKIINTSPTMPSNPNQMPEANNSVPLPKMRVETQTIVRIDEKEVQEIAIEDSKEIATKSEKMEEKKVEVVKEIVVEEVKEEKTSNTTVNNPTKKLTLVKNLPDNYNGYNVEIALTDIELQRDHSIFKQQSEVFVKQEGADKFSYYIGNFENIIVARNYYQSIAVPKFPSSRLCQFIQGKMTYTK